MNDKQMNEVLEHIARRGVPENINLWSEISAKLERKSPMKTLLTRPFAAVLITLVVLLTLSGAAYALGRSLGYFPGLGVVEEDAPFRVLSAPVSQTREGITVTVQQAVSNMDQMFVIFTVENIPPEKHSDAVLPGSKMCTERPEMRFPDGQKVETHAGVTSPMPGGYENRFKFSSIPLNADDASLFIPCIQGELEPGILPVKWELPLHFVPAPPQMAMTLIPVMDIPAVQNTVEPAPAPGIAPTSLPDAVLADRLAILQVIDTGDATILVGTFDPPVPPANEKGLHAVVDIVLRDGHDQVIADEEYPYDLDLTPYIRTTPGKYVWAVKFAENFVPPLRITYQTQYIYSPLPEESFAFEFDAGQYPQAGQEWDLDQEFQLSGYTVTLTKITAGVNSLTFFFQTNDERVESVGMYAIDDIRVEGFTPVNFGGSFGLGSWVLTKIYPELPAGKMKLILSGLYLYGDLQEWSLSWQP